MLVMYANKVALDEYARGAQITTAILLALLRPWVILKTPWV